MPRTSLRKQLLAAAMLLAGVPFTAEAGDIVPFGAKWSYLNPLTSAADPAKADATFDANWFKPSFNMNGANKFSGPSAEPFCAAPRTTSPSTPSIPLRRTSSAPPAPSWNCPRLPVA